MKAAIRPIRAVSLKRQRWARWIEYNYLLADLRAHGICEGCGDRYIRLEHHHVMGRGDEPWTSVSECLAVLCKTCHRAVTGEVGSGLNRVLRRGLKDEAEARMTKKYGLSNPTKLKSNYFFDSARNSLISKDAA